VIRRVLLSTMVLAFGIGTPAGADTNDPPPRPPPANGEFGGGRADDDGVEADFVGGVRGSSPIVERTSGANDGKVWVGIPTLGTTGDGGDDVVFCRRTRWVRVDPESRAEQVRRGEASFLGLFGGLPELEGQNPFLECPVDPTESIPAVVLREAVTQTIRDDLPRPEPEIPPGYALTGMPAFLVTNHQLDYGPVTHTVDLGVAVLDVTVTGSGVTNVDWGDGTQETYHSPGTPWPDGEVVHTYRDAQTVAITVTDTWQVTYRVPALGIEDSIEAPLPARTLESFEVQQIQAVRVSD
jgi:hypothetical protein